MRKDKYKKNDHEVWVSMDKWIANPYYQSNSDCEVSKLILANKNEFYNGDRNYDLFSVLANVRNDSNLRYISSPRGLPYDMSPELKDFSFIDKDDLYYHSWLLVKELIDFDWNQRYYYYGEYFNTRNTCSLFIKETIPKLLELGDPEDVRIIFWFGE
ncbi:hypothetical protein [Clostridium manihotivorum]|uniref:Uncharacterized protein n=1 Tax=Clostridium manihotivorum TaxID=2320868 RepID=A0A3R5UEU1_9CLOT|nr:hypothetical protein [Clostridium manihotivorum]QAA31775.1 hypothetical protein C1I91_09020 [Clostridium manihotivorum]